MEYMQDLLIEPKRKRVKRVLAKTNTKIQKYKKYRKQIPEGSFFQVLERRTQRLRK